MDKKVSCTFQKVSAGKEMVSIGVCIPRAELKLDEAAQLFVCSQLEATLCCDPIGNDENQATMINTDIEMTATCDVRGLAIKQDYYRASLSMPKTAVDERFYDFAGTNGSLFVKRIGDAQERRGRKSHDDADDVDEGDEE